jgi:sugar/nucleoside kinase (ribokinase family)
MTLKTSDIEKLSLNHFWLCDLLRYFVTGYGKPVPLELCYLLFPLVLRDKQRKALASANVKSTIYSIFLDKKEKRSLLAALQHYVDSYKANANEAIILYGNTEVIKRNKLLNSSKFDYKGELDAKIREYYKAAFNFGVIVSKEEANSCFYKLGVYKL